MSPHTLTLASTRRRGWVGKQDYCGIRRRTTLLLDVQFISGTGASLTLVFITSSLLTSWAAGPPIVPPLAVIVVVSQSRESSKVAGHVCVRKR